RDDRIDLIAMVEDEHRGTLLREVLLAEHIEVDARGGQQQRPRIRGEEIDAPTLAPGQQANAEGPRGDRRPGGDSGDRAQCRHWAAATATGEPQHRPAALGGDRRELAFGIRGPRVADEVHQRDIFVSVGVEVTLLQVDPVVRGELLYGVGLAGAPQDRLEHTAGEGSVFVDIETVAEDVVDTEEPRDGLDL